MSDVETSIRMWREAMKELTAQAESESHAKGVAEARRQMAVEAVALVEADIEEVLTIAGSRGVWSVDHMRQLKQRIEALAPREPACRRCGKSHADDVFVDPDVDAPREAPRETEG